MGDSDFILELQNVNKEPIVSKLEIDGENFQQICPINICKIEFTNSSFNPPKPDNITINHIIDFNLKYNSTDLNVDPMKKERTEKFIESMNACIIYDIIEDKGREIFFVIMEQILLEILILNLGIMILLEFMMQ